MKTLLASTQLKNERYVPKQLFLVPIVDISFKIKQKNTYQVAKEHVPTTSKQDTVSSSCEQDFPSYYSLQEHRRKEHGA